MLIRYDSKDPERVRRIIERSRDWTAASRRRARASASEADFASLRRDRLVGREGQAAQGHRHRRGARRGGAAADPAGPRLVARGGARAGCSSARRRSRHCSASTSASRRRSSSAANICPASPACRRPRANSGPMSTRCSDDEDLGAASFLESAHRRHFYFGIADGVKAGFVHFRQCDARLNAPGRPQDRDRL